MRLLPKKYKFEKIANVDVNGRPTALQTGDLRSFGTFTVYAWSQKAAIAKAANKVGIIYEAKLIQ